MSATQFLRRSRIVSCFFVLLPALTALFVSSLTTTAAVAQGAQSQATKDADYENDKTFSGNISWYGPHFNGKRTASGEIFDMQRKTAAHRTLSFSTKVLVEDPHTGQSVVVKVNDRGPFVKTRVMDLSRGGAAALGTINRGVTYVDCTILGIE